MKRTGGIILGVAALALGFHLVAGSNDVAPLSAQQETTVPAATRSTEATTGFQKVALRVENMTCAACSTIVRRTLEAVDGVSLAEISYAQKTAIVTYDPAKCSATQLVAATTGNGYPSTVLE